MKTTKVILLSMLILIINNNFAQKVMKYNKLSKQEEKVILKKGTEYPFTGKYWNHKEKGTYICRQCNAPLYKSDDKFDSNCGWPSFDDEIKGAVKRILDADGRRTEIICSNCGGHLGHVFLGEGFTKKDTRHCVNSISLDFIPAGKTENIDTVYFAGGCFWGTEHYFKKAKGVITTSVGYIGGHRENPTYREVCSGTTGHAEVVEVIYNPTMVDFEELAKLFFEIHDFTQIDRQGPDIGEQYRSEIFYTTDLQKDKANQIINSLIKRGYEVATEITPANKYFIAEDYHQDYYTKNGKQPYCHFKREIFK